jgi:hypothetical protein
MSLNSSYPPANSLNRSRPSRGTDRANQVGDALAAAPEVFEAEEAHRRCDGCRSGWLVNGLARIGYNAHSGSEGLSLQRGEHNDVCSEITADDPSEALGGVGVAIPGARYSQGSTSSSRQRLFAGMPTRTIAVTGTVVLNLPLRAGYSPSRSAWSRATCTRAGLSALHRSIE